MTERQLDEKLLKEMREFARGLPRDLGPEFGLDVIRLLDDYEALLRRLEKAEQRIEMAQYHFRQIGERRLDAPPPPQQFWDRLRAIQKALDEPERGTHDRT